MKNLPDIKAEILSRLNIKDEIEILGVKHNDKISKTGWLTVHNPYKRDQNPSCGIQVGSGSWKGFLVAHNDIGENGKPHRAIGFFDLAADFLPGLNGDYRAAVQYYAEKTGVSTKTYQPPTDEMLQQYIRGITPEVREYLHVKRGLTDASIEKYKLGWSIRKERLVIPVFDSSGNLVNFRYHNSNKKPKTLNLEGYGEARLWGIDRLVKAPTGSIVAMTEGEGDSQLLEQETGLVSVSPTNGCKAFLEEWVHYFRGHHVVLVWDCDAEGRKAVRNLILPSFRKAIEDKQVLSISVVWLFDKASKDEKDFTDFIIKAGGSGAQLLEKIEMTPAHEYVTPSTALPEPIPLTNFIQINDEKFAGKRVTVPLYIFGENSEAYSAPTEVEVTFCQDRESGKCHGREDWDWVCERPIPIRIGDRVQLACVRASDAQIRGTYREYVCDRNKRPAINLKDDKKITLTEVYAHQVMENHDLSESNEMIEKPVYIIGGKAVPIGKYQATGFVHANPRDQRPVMLIDSIEPQEADWQSFDTDVARPLLREIQEHDPIDIVHELSIHVTKILERDDLHMGTLLTLCSPRWVNLPGDGKIRNWLNVLIIGDTGCGKTACVEGVFKFADVGYRVSGMTSSRTGITYAMDHDEKRGWRIKAGALLKMSRQALIVDEAQDLEEEDLKTMAEAIDTGQLRIARIETRTFESETRVIFICNPKADDRKANQRPMSSFLYGCTSFKDIFPQMMIRRIDLCLFAASGDIKDKSKIYNPQTSDSPQWLTREHLRALIHYAWNLDIEQIIISPAIATLIRQEALKLAEKYGGCDADLPIVYPEDFRKTFCRIVTAFAVLDLASDDDFQTITVGEKHVDFVSDFLNTIYSADNCKLHRYAKVYDAKNHLNDMESKKILDVFRNEFSISAAKRERLKIIFEELMRLDPYKFSRITQAHFVSLLEVSRQTVSSDIDIFIKNGLASSSKGYKPTIKLFLLKEKIEEIPGFWEGS